MAYYVDGTAARTRKVNYEPSSTGGLAEAPQGRQPISPRGVGPGWPLRRSAAPTTTSRRASATAPCEAWERDDLVQNLVDNLLQCEKHIQERMVGHFTLCDPDYGRRVAEGLGHEPDRPSAHPRAGGSALDGTPNANKENGRRSRPFSLFALF